MAFEMKAEYEFRAVLAWHIVPEGGTRTLCRRPLAPTAPTRKIEELQLTRSICPACRSAYMLLPAGRKAAVKG